MREVGSQAAANMWGNVYPRSGFVTQVDDDKVGALVAQRVADIITRSGQPRISAPDRPALGRVLASRRCYGEHGYRQPQVATSGAAAQPVLRRVSGR